MAIVSMSYAEMNPKTAEQITYDNTESGLEAENVQDAVDEVNDKIDAVFKKIVPTPYGTVTFVRTGKQVLASFTTGATAINFTSGQYVKLCDIPNGYKSLSSPFNIGASSIKTSDTILINVRENGVATEPNIIRITWGDGTVVTTKSISYIICSISYLTNDEMPMEDIVSV